MSKAQEKEVADQLERSLGLNPDHGWIRNTDNIIANVSKIYGMTDEDWDKLQTGGEIDIRNTVDGMSHLVEEISSPPKKDKGVK